MESEGVGHQQHPSLLYAIKQVELAIRSHLDTLLKPYGITALQYTALTVLQHSADLSAADLARRSFVTAQSMGEMVDTLQRQGLVSRHTDPQHRRRMLMTLTADGRRLLAECDDAVNALEAAMVAGLSWRQRRALRVYLDSCRAALH
ncbi:MarR family winged helix-turn-helix transcriptional regulator [Mycolicibacterium austroafricanum]|uniref:MarR family winged helix-turn-helix transcriptional regulator n=1 Tax=Mycolicibacterium austroafricanum TaxID=39687 RepID=UPI0005684A55|nr:MarR family transcriptional regulator [Mycolicibacterium austroafricanum]